MPNELITTLDAIADRLEKAGSAVDLLQPGLPEDAARVATKSLPFELPFALLTLYGWRNGTMKGDQRWCELHPGFALLSLEEAMAHYWSQHKAGRVWRKTWFPVLANDGGDYELVDCATADDTPVIHSEFDEDSMSSYASMLDYARTTLSCYERGIFTVDAKGFVDADDVEWWLLARELNPDAELWKQAISD